MSKTEDQFIASILDECIKNRDKLKKILDANDERLDKAQGTEWNQLQDRVSQLQSAYDSLQYAINDLTNL